MYLYYLMQMITLQTLTQKYLHRLSLNQECLLSIEYLYLIEGQLYMPESIVSVQLRSQFLTCSQVPFL